MIAEKLSAMDVYNAVNGGRGKLLGRVGVQSRSVYEIDGVVYEKAINFEDGKDHSHYYPVEPQRANELRCILGK